MRSLLAKTTLALTAALIAVPGAHAAIKQPPGGRLVALAPVRDYSRGIDITAIQPVESLRDVRYEDIQKIIPADLAPTSNGGQVAAQILDHSLSNFFNSSAVKNSELGAAAHKVDKSMESEAAFGGETAGSIKHCFKFQMRAAQTKAQIEYTGLTNAYLTYQIAQSTMNFEVNERLANDTHVVFNHIAKPGDITDMVSVRWAW